MAALRAEKKIVFWLLVPQIQLSFFTNCHIYTWYTIIFFKQDENTFLKIRSYVDQ